ncbi:MAG TPA: hypothetical protein VHA54_09660 [Solirubrobacterales bacterium]|nr:hypothetical protein [Solirubrobacterales bacterium]
MSTVVYAPGVPIGDSEDGPPERMEFASRIQPQFRYYKGLPVAITELPPSLPGPETPPWIKPVSLAIDVEAEDTTQALATAGSVVEALVDLMSFDMGASLRLGQVEVINITPPLGPGDEREFMIFGEAPFSLNSRALDMGAIRGRMQGELPDSDLTDDSRLAAALRWFVKSLGTDLVHDQFIFLWIALEIVLDDSEAVRVRAPYKGPCGHLIASCPECDRPTGSLVRGATSRAFLETFGIDPGEARDLWAMRQLMHGAIPFDSKKLDGLRPLTQTLRAVVAAALKNRLAMDPSQPPLIALSGPSIHPAMAVTGSRGVTRDETQPLAPNTG